ncbi:hypothetical protein ABZS77_04395 [Micromonospora sp. NPDC005298]|uniref:DUF7674 family protein n=1 Tax=Micromonospora sp. NPDC005298 TaxID=3156873 RepID=UPI0033B9F9D1
MAISDLLAAEDEIEAVRWREESEPGCDLPLLLRLTHLAEVFAERVQDLTPQQRRNVLHLVDEVLGSGDQHEADAVATGFLESLMTAADAGFDLRQIWSDLGPRSQAYCRAWDAFLGIASPDWMREP